MDIVWDERKNESDIRKHGLDVNDAHLVFGGPLFVAPDDREEYGEDRWVGIGLLNVLIVYTESDDGIVRIVSLRKALEHERQRFRQYLLDRLGPG